MRLAILADIHGNQKAFEAVLTDLKEAGGADKTWILGDLCALGPRPTECLQMIREIPEVQVISGNTDRYVTTGKIIATPPKDEAEWQQFPTKLHQAVDTYGWTMAQLSYADYEYLSKLQHEVELHIPGYGWVIGYHGAPGNDEYMLLPDTPAEETLDQFLDQEGRLGFGGHTHVPMDRDLGQWRVVNVGAVGLPKDEQRACYVLVDFTDGTANIAFRRVAYDIDAVIADLKQQDHPATERIIGMLTGQTSA
ncbi:MAG: metallophosphoesterase family protein [Chloroflexota bacterium]